MDQMPEVREAIFSDLKSVLELYSVSEVSSAVSSIKKAEKIWKNIVGSDTTIVFVSEPGDYVVASCVLIISPNLLREGRAHGFIENVVTHPEFQGRGHGGAVVRAALAKAWASDCHHVLMQSGRKDPSVHRFYENCGFTSGLRTAYVANRPS